MAQTYDKVKTGQDLLDLGIVPKDSSAHLGLIAYKRLTVLRDRINASINEDMLGRWLPLAKPVYEEVPGRFIDDGVIHNSEAVLKYGTIGTRIRATKDNDGLKADNRGITGFEGVIRSIERDNSSIVFGIHFDKNINGHDLSNRNSRPPLCPPGHGLFMSPSVIELLCPESKVVTGYEMADGIVADERLGHKLRYKSDCETTGIIGRDRKTFSIKKGYTANLLGYDKSNRTLSLETLIKPARGRKAETYRSNIKLEDAAALLEASSLGQIEPLDKNEEIRKQALAEFFPRTVVDPDVAEGVVQMMIMGRDVLLYGPPGSGKTNIAKDIVAVAQQQGVIFTVDGCQVQCNPFSLFNPAFAEAMPACPECKIRHCPSFKHTGIFIHPQPKDVKVNVCRYGEGEGIEWVEGTVGLKRTHLAGYKLPKLDGSTSDGIESDYDPDGFHPGVLPRTNNGVLHLDELDKLLPQTQEGLLSALNSNSIKPDQLRFCYPSHAYVVGTANDSTKFHTALIDRMMLHRIDYPSDAEVSASISRKAYYQQFDPATNVPIGDTHTERPLSLRRVIMPAPVENAIDAFYLVFRKEYKGSGVNDIIAGNRSKFDAFDAARSTLLIKQVFHKETPHIAMPAYAVQGIRLAMSSRVQEMNAETLEKIADELSAWIDERFPKLLEQEEDAWWCKTRKHIAIAKTQIPIIQDKFVEEIGAYKAPEWRPQSAINVFKDIKRAHDAPQNRKLQAARIEYPFMDYLFKAQPNMPLADEAEVVELVRYLITNDRNCTSGAKDAKK